MSVEFYFIRVFLTNISVHLQFLKSHTTLEGGSLENKDVTVRRGRQHGRRGAGGGSDSPTDEVKAKSQFPREET